MPVLAVGGANSRLNEYVADQLGGMRAQPVEVWVQAHPLCRVEAGNREYFVQRIYRVS